MLANVPLYLGYVGTMVALLAGFAFIYTLVTPYHELRLIRTGNTAAAYSFGGTLIGLALPLFSVAAHSYSLLDMLVWGGIGLAFQLLVFLVATLLLRGFREGIEADRLSYGILLAAMSIAVGILNAGSLTE